MMKDIFFQKLPEINGLKLDEAAEIMGCTPASLRVRFSTHFSDIVHIVSGTVCLNEVSYRQRLRNTCFKSPNSQETWTPHVGEDYFQYLERKLKI
jgi:hypothetical protein